MSDLRLYSKEELVSLYSQVLQNEKDKIVKAIRPGTFVPFIKTGIMTEDQEEDWSSMSREMSRKALIDLVLARNNLDCYLKFSQGVYYVDAVKAKRIFKFIADLNAVGLHDPLKRTGSVTLSPRSPTCHTKVVVLWIMGSRDLFQSVNRLIPGPTYRCDNLGQRYDCQKSSPEDKFEIYTVCCDTQSEAPGRKFDGLLVKFEPCPDLVVYSGDSEPVSSASVTALKHGHCVVASGSGSEFDWSAETVHAAKLYKLRKEGTVKCKVLQVGLATKYLYEDEAIVHCPDAVTLHRAAALCHLPTVALVRIGKEGNDDRSYCQYVLDILRELVTTM